MTLLACRGREQTPVAGRSDATFAEGLAQRPQSTSFDLNGYRHTHTWRTAPRPIGLVVLGITDKVEKARRLARRAQAALGLPYEDLQYDPTSGFVYPDSSCVEQPAPCPAPSRLEDEPFAYISIEQGHYERWRSREFIVVAAHGAPGSDLLRETLAKAKASFPEAYEEATRRVWIEAESRKLRDDELPAPQPAPRSGSRGR